ncbi:hypothetical protein ANN_11202 [Periplaneta americana]|uniref:Uncharacterized protein n=1 Tax=Periplaneta americana TaxID=6978 RepID=A0ABQ8T620_PERAM|nr:hypothetical protein ANN_11202 [Periplaneta americana]
MRRRNVASMTIQQQGKTAEDVKDCAERLVILRRFINIFGYLASECDGDDNAGEMSPGSSTESYPAFAHIGLRENPRKNLNQMMLEDIYIARKFVLYDWKKGLQKMKLTCTQKECRENLSVARNFYRNEIVIFFADCWQLLYGHDGVCCYAIALPSYRTPVSGKVFQSRCSRDDDNG